MLYNISVLFSSYLLINSHITFLVVTAASVNCQSDSQAWIHPCIGVPPDHNTRCFGFRFGSLCDAGLGDGAYRALIWSKWVPSALKSTPSAVEEEQCAAVSFSALGLSL